TKNCGYVVAVNVGMVWYTSGVMLIVAVVTAWAPVPQFQFRAAQGTVTSLPPLLTIRYSTWPPSVKTMSSTTPAAALPCRVMRAPRTCLARTALGRSAGWVWAAGTPGGWAG